MDSGSGSRSVNRCLPVAARSFCVSLPVFEEGKVLGGTVVAQLDLVSTAHILVKGDMGITEGSSFFCCDTPQRQDFAG